MQRLVPTSCTDRDRIATSNMGLGAVKLGAFAKDALRAALYQSGALPLWHFWRNRHALTVLMFHRVLPADDSTFGLAEREFTFTLEGFRHTLDFVQRHYNAVGLEDLEIAQASGKRLPRTPLLITFDDGWRDTLIHALPELDRRKLPAVLFVASEVVALDEPRWWADALAAVVQQPGAAARLAAIAGCAGDLPDNSGQALAAHLGAMSPEGRRAWFDQHAPGVLAQISERQMVNLGELESLHGPSLSLGGHGHTHSPLTQVAEPTAELQASRRLLDPLDRGTRSMSFPHGAWSGELAAIARSVGFEWLFSSQAALVDVAAGPESARVMGRIHLPENAWTCTRGRIDPARLATFLFFRPIQRS